MVQQGYTMAQQGYTTVQQDYTGFSRVVRLQGKVASAERRPTLA